MAGIHAQERTFAVPLGSATWVCPNCCQVLEADVLRIYVRRLDGSLAHGIVRSQPTHRAPCGLLCTMSPSTDAAWTPGEPMHTEARSCRGCQRLTASCPA